MQAQEMIKALENKLAAMRKDMAGLVVALDQVKAAFVAEIGAAAEAAAPRPVDVFSPAFKDRLRAEFLAEANVSPAVRRGRARLWTLEAKRRILHEISVAQQMSRQDPKNRGAVKRVLGKYGITSAHVVQWRDQVKAAARPRAS